MSPLQLIEKLKEFNTFFEYQPSYPFKVFTAYGYSDTKYAPPKQQLSIEKIDSQQIFDADAIQVGSSQLNLFIRYAPKKLSLCLPKDTPPKKLDMECIIKPNILITHNGLVYTGSNHNESLSPILGAYATLETLRRAYGTFAEAHDAMKRPL